MKRIFFVPYPIFSDDKNIYFRLELLRCSFSINTVIGSGSAILARATMNFSYLDYYLYNEELLEKMDADYEEEEALERCIRVSKAIWG